MKCTPLLAGFLLGAMAPLVTGWGLLVLILPGLWLLRQGQAPLVAVVLAGMAWTTGAVHQVNDLRLTESTDFQGLEVAIDRCWQSDWSTRCLLRDPHGHRYYLTWQAEAAPEPGLSGLASGRLQPWTATVSPGQTSFALWLLRHGIAARGQVGDFQPRDPSGIAALQLQVRRTLRARDVPEQARGFYEALILGDRSALDSAVRGQVARTQTQHLLALSGLHIGSLALWAYGLAGLVWRLCPVGVRQDWQKLAALTMAAGLLWVALPAVSLWRAFLMTLIPGLAWLSRRHFATHQLLLLIGCLMVLADPLIWLDLGAWFSWWATLVLIMLVRHIGHWPGWQQLIGIQLSLSALLVPVHALWALPLFPAGMVLNLILIPWVSFVTLPLAFLTALGVPGVGILLGWATQVWRWLLAVFDHLIVLLPVLSPLQALLLGALAALGLLTHWPGRAWGLWLVLAVSISLLQARGPALQPGEFDLWALDSGSGQAVVIETAEGRVLVDTGAGRGESLNLSQPVLRWHWRYPFGKWHTLVLSRPGRQTEGGLGSLEASLEPPVQAFSARPPRRWPESWPAPRFCDLDRHWVLGGVEFRFLRPVPGYQPTDTRAGSCVLAVSSNRGRALIVNGPDAMTGHALVQYGQLPVADVVITAGNLADGRPVVQGARPDRVLLQQPMHRNPPPYWLGAETECTCGRQSWRYRFTESGFIPVSYGLRLLPWLRI